VAAGRCALLDNADVQQVAVADVDGFLKMQRALENALPGDLVVVLSNRAGLNRRIVGEVVWDVQLSVGDGGKQVERVGQPASFGSLSISLVWPL